MIRPQACLPLQIGQARKPVLEVACSILMAYRRCSHNPVRGMSLRKVSLLGLHFFCIFEKPGINKATDLAVSQLTQL